MTGQILYFDHELCTEGCTAIPDEQPLRCGFCGEEVVIGVPGLPNPHWRPLGGSSRCRHRGQTARSAS
jgi:hypothetical protein